MPFRTLDCFFVIRNKRIYTLEQGLGGKSGDGWLQGGTAVTPSARVCACQAMAEDCYGVVMCRIPRTACHTVEVYCRTGPGPLDNEEATHTKK